VPASEPPAPAAELAETLPDFSEAQSAPVAPPSGGEPAQPTAQLAQTEKPAPVAEPTPAPTWMSPDSRPLDFSGSASTGAPAKPEALPNGGFEESSEGWEGANAALSRVRGVTGNAVRVSRATTDERFAFYAVKELVSRKAGSPYRVAAHVRTVSPGMLVCLRIEEYAGGAPLTTERCLPARSGWRRMRVEGQTIAKGSKLVFSIHVMAALGGTSFDVDSVRLAQS
jgi:hypothetical protein